jgi:hypothetical protein
MSADTGDLAPFLADVHTEDHEHRKQSQGKKKCHSGSVIFNAMIHPSHEKPLKKWLTTGERF